MFANSNSFSKPVPATPQKKRKQTSARDYLEKQPTDPQFEGRFKESQNTLFRGLSCRQIELRKANESQFTRDNFHLENKTIYLKLDNHDFYFVIGPYDSNGVTALGSIWLNGQRMEGFYRIGLNNVNPFSSECRSFSISILGVDNIKAFLKAFIHPTLSSSPKTTNPLSQSASFYQAQQKTTAASFEKDAAGIEWEDDSALFKKPLPRKKFFPSSNEAIASHLQDNSKTEPVKSITTNPPNL